MQVPAHCESRPSLYCRSINMSVAYLSIAICQARCWYPYLHMACVLSDTLHTADAIWFTNDLQQSLT